MKFTNEHKDKIRQSHLLRNADKMNQICEMAIHGKTTKEIASFFNQTITSINKTLRRRGVKAIRGANPKKGVSTNPQKIKDICEMAKQGKTAKEIADFYTSKGFRHSAGHIYKILDIEGIILQRFPDGRPNSNPNKNKEICDMFRSGMKVAEIAKHFNFKGSARVCRVLTNNGIIENRRKKKTKREDGCIEVKDGYLERRISNDDPLFCMVSKKGYVLEHRYVLANKLGRPLTKNETVHHIDGNKQNNNPDNLQLRTGKHGKGQAMKCAECGSEDISSLEWLQCNKCNSTRIKFDKL